MILKTKLMKHQIDAVNKMIPSRVGALFMEMGTGKSRTAIELAAIREQKIDKVIWFCPVSLKETIRQEIIKHVNNANDNIYIFGQKKQDNIQNCFWNICGIESMSSSISTILNVKKIITDKTFVIVDESSYIKGHNSNRTQIITQLSKISKYRLILTGTPISQGLVDLYSQLYFLSPKILGYNSFWSFANNHLEYSEKYLGMIVRAHNINYIAAKMAPYVYQITKKECLDLPDKTYQTIYFAMDEEQREWYDKIKEKAMIEIDQREDSYFNSILIFKLFSSLQQIVCGFYNERLDKISTNKKTKAEKIFKMHTFKNKRVDILSDIVHNIDSSQKVIIFCKFQKDVEYIERELLKYYKESDISFFHGKLTEKERKENIDKFRGEAKIFIATQQSGGHGLTLNEANNVIFYNNAFKFSERMQAEDRCHRIGQTDKVIYFDIICSDSIDERISRSLGNKSCVVTDFKNEINKIKKEKLKEVIKKL